MESPVTSAPHTRSLCRAASTMGFAVGDQIIPVYESSSPQRFRTTPGAPLNTAGSDASAYAMAVDMIDTPQIRFQLT
jgi:hypothetical protein